MIEKSKNWNYCIDIYINLYSQVNVEQIYHTLLWFATNEILPCISISVMWERKDKIVIFEQINSFKLLKMNIHDFQKWLFFRIHTDKKYDPLEKMVYGFKLIFSPQMVNAYNVKYKTDVLINLINDNPKHNSFRTSKILRYSYKNKLFKLYSKFPFLKIMNIHFK
jgi:hypothetical protein